MSSGENITMNILGRCATAGVLDFKKLRERADMEVKAMPVPDRIPKAAGRRALRWQSAEALIGAGRGQSRLFAHPYLVRRCVYTISHALPVLLPGRCDKRSFFVCAVNKYARRLLTNAICWVTYK